MKRNRGGRRGGGVVLDSGRESLVSSSGGVLIEETGRLSGLKRDLSAALAGWRPARAVHDPGKIVHDLATAVVLGGDCLADIAAVRAQPDLFGEVASDPTVCRLIHTLAGDADRVIAGIGRAKQRARTRVWQRQRPIPGTPGSGVVIDLDATLVDAHSDKEGAEPTYKRGYGFHPFFAFADHGPTGTGEVLAAMLRRGGAAANIATDHIELVEQAVTALPADERAPEHGRILVRTDSAGGTKQFLRWLTEHGLEYSVGFPATAAVAEAIEQIPRQAWRAAIDADGKPRNGAQVAELTAWMPSPSTPGRDRWPERIRIIARRERPHPGAQLRLTDPDGWRITCFATNTRGGRLAELEVRHRQRARAEDRIRALKDLGLTNLPFHSFAANQIWLQIITLAHDLLAWTQNLAFDQDQPARRWEPKRLRLRVLAVAGRITRSARRELLRLPRGWPWNHHIDHAWNRLRHA